MKKTIQQISALAEQAYVLPIAEIDFVLDLNQKEWTVAIYPHVPAGSLKDIIATDVCQHRMYCAMLHDADLIAMY